MSWASGSSIAWRSSMRISGHKLFESSRGLYSFYPRLGWKVSAISCEGGAVLDRQADGEGTAVTLAAVDGQRAAMLGDDLERHCQADTAAANARNVLCSLECFKDPRQVRRGYAYPLVTHRQDRPGSRVVLISDDRDGDHPAIRTVLDGVAQQIVENALEPRRVPLAHQLRFACQLDDVPL